MPVDEDTLMRLVSFVNRQHHEAVRCAKAGAYLAAVVFIASAVEGVLLVTALLLRRDLYRRGLWPEGDPFRWDLDKLLKLSRDAGWLTANAPGEVVLLNEGELGDAVYWLKQARNLVHPGAYIRDTPPEFEPHRVGVENAYKILEAVFDVSVAAYERIDPDDS